MHGQPHIRSRLVYLRSYNVSEKMLLPYSFMYPEADEKTFLRCRYASSKLRCSRFDSTRSFTMSCSLTIVQTVKWRTKLLTTGKKQRLNLFFYKILTFCWPCISVYLSQQLTNMMHKIFVLQLVYFMPQHVSSIIRRSKMHEETWRKETQPLVSSHL